MSHRIGKASSKRAKHQVKNVNGGTPHPCKKVVPEATRSLLKNSTTKGNQLSTSYWSGVLKDPHVTTIIWVPELKSTDFLKIPHILLVRHGEISCTDCKVLVAPWLLYWKALKRLLEETVTDSLVQL